MTSVVALALVGSDSTVVNVEAFTVGARTSFQNSRLAPSSARGCGGKGKVTGSIAPQARARASQQLRGTGRPRAGTTPAAVRVRRGGSRTAAQLGRHARSPQSFSRPGFINKSIKIVWKSPKSPANSCGTCATAAALADRKRPNYDRSSTQRACLRGPAT